MGNNQSEEIGGETYSEPQTDRNGVPYDEYISDENFNMRKLERTANTGDILLFSGSSLFSKSIKFITDTPWTHVAVVIRKGKNVFVLQAIFETSKKYYDYLTKTWRNSGVMLNRLSDVIVEDEGKVYYRKLKMKGGRVFDPIVVENFLDSVSGKRYEMDPFILLSSPSRGNIGEDPSSYFCSELVIDFWRANGLLDEKYYRVNPQNVIPSDFVYEDTQAQFKLKEWAKLGPLYKLN